MIEYPLNLGEYIVTKKECIISCYGLGSCVGVFIYDRVNKIAAAAHVVLPDNLEKETNLNAKTIFPILIKDIQKKGGNIEALRIKLVGGSQMFNTEINIGKRIISNLKQLILENKIYLASSDLGGNKSRTVKFNTKTGDLNIISQKNNYII